MDKHQRDKVLGEITKQHNVDVLINNAGMGEYTHLFD